MMDMGTFLVAPARAAPLPSPAAWVPCPPQLRSRIPGVSSALKMSANFFLKMPHQPPLADGAEAMVAAVVPGALPQLVYMMAGGVAEREDLLLV